MSRAIAGTRVLGRSVIASYMGRRMRLAYLAPDVLEWTSIENHNYDYYILYVKSYFIGVCGMIKPKDSVISILSNDKSPMIVKDILGNTAYCWKPGWDKRRTKAFSLKTLKIFDESSGAIA